MATGRVPSSSSNGQMAKPAAERRASWVMPRIEPVPTAPAPPIWKIDFAGARSLTRRLRVAGFGFGRFGRPQNGGSQAASSVSPVVLIACQISWPLAHPFCVLHQAGKPKAKSRPTTSRGVPAR